MTFSLLDFYVALMRLAGGPCLRALLRWRLAQGKEDPARLPERMGRAGKARPPGPLVWIHGASVGEAQSALILIDRILEREPACGILLTTGTVSSAGLMTARLPPGAFHQYYPLDHPDWTAAFLDHWRPDAALWIESELWPCMLDAIQTRNIPAALVNARLSPRSLRRWRLIPKTAQALMKTFRLCLAQSEIDADSLRSLGAVNVSVAGNLKFSAAPLTCDQTALKNLRTALGSRPCWLYASTHAGEEELACRIHGRLKEKIPDLLTILVPRHPERGDDIRTACEPYGLNLCLRGPACVLPDPQTEIYIADTFGELGLFYRLSPLACVGRSFSLDGGGGHNPIEPARLGCAVLHGPAVGNLAQIYQPMDRDGAALCVQDEAEFSATVLRLLTDSDCLKALQDRGRAFAQDQDGVIDRVLAALDPVLKPARRES